MLRNVHYLFKHLNSILFFNDSNVFLCSRLSFLHKNLENAECVHFVLELTFMFPLIGKLLTLRNQMKGTE